MSTLVQRTETGSPREVANQPIVIVGPERSGTTWFETVLRSSPRVHYVHEPFNRWAPRPPGPRSCPFAGVYVPHVPADHPELVCTPTARTRSRVRSGS